jgi:hypothetical protein
MTDEHMTSVTVMSDFEDEVGVLPVSTGSSCWVRCIFVRY